MVSTVDEAIAAGALGVLQLPGAGPPHPRRPARPGHLRRCPTSCIALSEPLRTRGRGVYEVVPRFETDNAEDWHQARSEVALDGRRVPPQRPAAHLRLLPVPPPARAVPRDHAAVGRGQRRPGANVRPQSTARGIGILFGARIRSPFDRNPSWKAIRDLPVAEKLAAYADPARRAVLVAEAEANGPFATDLERHYLLEGPDPDYRPDPARSLPALAAARGVTHGRGLHGPDGRRRAARPSSTTRCSTRPSTPWRRCCRDPMVVLGLADSGAHVKQIMDASQPTWFLTHWVRDRGVFGLPDAIRRLTSDTAQLFGHRGPRRARARRCGPTSTSSTSTACASPCPRSSTTSPAAPAG